MRLNVIFHSIHGHVFVLAKAVFEGASKTKGAKVGLYQVPETLDDDTISRMGATESKRSFAHIPVAHLENLQEADALVFGTPTRFGMMSAQMRTFLDSTGPLWAKGALVNKVGSVFTSSGTQHGGQESTILSFHVSLLHHGMILVGVPFTEKGLLDVEQVGGGTPYGASTIAGPDGSRTPTESDLAIARFQGKHVAEIAARLHG